MTEDERREAIAEWDRHYERDSDGQGHPRTPPDLAARVLLAAALDALRGLLDYSDRPVFKISPEEFDAVVARARSVLAAADGAGGVREALEPLMRYGWRNPDAVPDATAERFRQQHERAIDETVERLAAMSAPPLLPALRAALPSLPLEVCGECGGRACDRCGVPYNTQSAHCERPYEGSRHVACGCHRGIRVRDNENPKESRE